MKLLSESFKIINAEISKDNWDNSGICTTIDFECSGKFSREEKIELKDYLDRNLPEKTWPNKLGGSQYDTSGGHYLAFCWDYGVKEPRIKWLTEQIEKLEKLNS